MRERHGIKQKIKLSHHRAMVLFRWQELLLNLSEVAQKKAQVDFFNGNIQEQTEQALVTLLPWSSHIPDNCKMPSK